MKIIFICSCLEEGFDGVGDYTRRLASEVVRKNNAVALIALNDKYVEDKLIDNQQELEISLSVLRLPANLPLKTRLSEARHYIDKFDPDWLSLQFVIFGYHPKGLPFGLGGQLTALGEGRRWHIMFHELWVGMALESPVKQRYWGIVQKNIIKRLIHSLKPAVIHTHSTLYQAQLNKIGFKAGRLKLFGNIPVQNNRANGHLPPASGKPLMFVVFGTIHPGSPIKQFAREVAAYAEREKVQILLKIIGRSGPELDHWVNEWKSAGLPVEIMGERPTALISQLLSTASAGISSSAYFMIEKSGTAAAMLEHGLPVICVSGAYTPRGVQNLTFDPSVIEYKAGNLNECLSKIKSVLLDNTVTDIANQLVASLGDVSEPVIDEFMNPIKVSVCIPTYNQAVYLEQAIRSCTAQTLKPFEIIVYDDYSTDETPRILKKLAEQIDCLKIFRQEKNTGISRNVDACLRAAGGDFVVRLDSDDFLAPLYIEKLTGLLTDNPGAAYAHAAVQEVDQQGRFLRQRLLARKAGFQNNIDGLKASAKGFKVAANILIFRRSALEKAGYIASKVNFAEDYYLVASLAAEGYGNVYINEILSYYRVWTDAGKVRQRRKLEEILGYRKLFEEVLEPAYRQLGWSTSVLKKRRADFACRHMDCLAWDLYSAGEKLELKNELNKLSSSIRSKWFGWMYLNGFGKILNGYEQFKISAKDTVKKILLRK